MHDAELLVFHCTHKPKVLQISQQRLRHDEVSSKNILHLRTHRELLTRIETMKCQSQHKRCMQESEQVDETAKELPPVHSGQLGRRLVDFSNHRVPIDFGRCACMVHSPSRRRTLGLRPTDQSCHHETWLHLDFVDCSNTLSKQGDHDRHISLKERPQLVHTGTKNDVSTKS